MNDLANRAAKLLGAELRAVQPLHGGDLSQILCISLTDGRDAIVKGGPAPRAEAAMLEAIRASGAPAPVVLGVDDEVLVIEALPSEGRPADAWPGLGTVLATLHATTGRRYGWARDYAFGAVTIANAWSDEWPTFWGERRLLAHAPHVPAALARRIEALAANLSNRLPRQPRAALLHGDLWGGNVLVARGGVSGLIDPACYYGHTEVDIAMLTLFDTPDGTFFESYDALDPGYDERRPIYQLWPALVHLRLFGAGYRPMVERFLAACRV